MILDLPVWVALTVGGFFVCLAFGIAATAGDDDQ